MFESKQAGENLAYFLGLSDERRNVSSDGKKQGTAQQRLDAQIGKLKTGGDMAYLNKLQNMADETDAEFKQRTSGMKLKPKGSGDFAGLGATLAKNFGPLVGGIQAAAGKKIDDLKRNASFIGELGKAAFTGDAIEKPKQFAPQLAGAMTKGSAGAYSTIVQAMTRRSDPQVKATEKGTKEIVKAIVSKPPAIFNLIAAFTP
jgi:hypothetical protein